MLITDWNDHDAFLRAIHAHPDEDAPRLIYADWLEESGEPIWTHRAELIRVQVELGGKTKKSKRRKVDLQMQEKELLATVPDEWLGPWASPLVQWHFRRGMPEFFSATTNGTLDLTSVYWITFEGDGKLGFSENGNGLTWYGSYQIQFTYAQVKVFLEAACLTQYYWLMTRDPPNTEGNFHGELQRVEGVLSLQMRRMEKQRRPKGEPYTLNFIKTEERTNFAVHDEVPW